MSPLTDQFYVDLDTTPPPADLEISAAEKFTGRPGAQEDHERMQRWIADQERVEQLPPPNLGSDLSIGKCKFCGATIRWAKNAAGNSIPLNPEPLPRGKWLYRQMGGGPYAAWSQWTGSASEPGMLRHRCQKGEVA